MKYKKLARIPGFTNLASDYQGYSHSGKIPINPKLNKFKSWIDVSPEVINPPNREIEKAYNSLCSCNSVTGWTIPIVSQTFYRHLKAFKEKLIFWEDLTKDKKTFMPAIEVAKRCILFKSEFATFVDDALSASLRHKGNILYDPGEDTDIYDDAWGHDYFFSPRNLLNFKIPEKKSDINKLFEEPKPINKPDCNLFRIAVRSFLINGNYRTEVDDLDMLSLFGANKVYTPGEDKSSRKYDKHIGKSFRFEHNKNLKFKYSWVQKNAAEGRAAVVCDSDTLYKIKWFHKAFKEHTSCPEDYYSDPDVFSKAEKFLKNTKDGVHEYLMSDLKKSGLTFNRTLYNIIIEELYEYTGDERFQHFIDYGKATVVVDGGEPKPITNGCGLGMMDCVISFTQAIIYNIMLEDYPNITSSYDLKGMFWSDDSTVRLTHKDREPIDQEFVVNYMNLWNGYLSRFGMTVHEVKPFFSKMGVLLEIYTDRFWMWDVNKTCQFGGCVLDALTATDIVAAKEITSTVCMEAGEEQLPWIDELIVRVVDQWGYEFNPIEVELPHECGGWLYEVRSGKNCLLQYLDEREDHEELLTRFSRIPLLKPRRRILDLHRKHQEYISSIVSKGVDDGDMPFSWKRMASSALLFDYKQAGDIVALRRRIISDRQRAFQQKFDWKENEIFQNMIKISMKVKDDTWYVPIHTTQKEIPPSMPTAYPKEYIGKGFGPAEYIFVTTGRGSKVSVNRQSIDAISDVPADYCRRILGKMFPKGLVSKEELILGVTYGVHPGKFMNELPREMFGQYFNKSLGNRHDTEEFFLKVMYEYEEASSFVSIPNVGLIGLKIGVGQEGILTQYGEDLAKYVAVILMPGSALKVDKPTLALVLEVQGALEEYLEVRIEQKPVQIFDIGPSIVPSYDVDAEDTIRYYTSMIEGFNRAVELGYNGPPEPDPVIAYDLGDGYSIASSDDALGNMFD